MRALTELGLRSCLDGIDAVPVHGYGVFNGEQVVELPYPSDEDSVDEDADGKRAMGMSFHQ